MSRWREILFGGPRRLGFWTLPVFLIVGLAGAVIAGSLTVVYYAQQVRDLEEQTAASRQELDDAVEEVQAAGDEALTAIENQVAAVEETLTRQLPVEDVSALGVVVIRAVRNVPPPQPPPPAPEPEPEPPAGTDEPDGAPVPGLPEGQADPSESEPPAESPSPSPSPTPSPTPTPAPLPTPSPTPPPPPEPQLGMGFAVATSDGSTFFATSYGLVADPRARAGVVESVEVITTEGTFVATVHDWDEDRDLAIVRSRFTGLTIPTWRPRSEAIAVGERLWVVGITPTRVTVQLPVTTGYVTNTEILVDVGRKDLLRGAPIVDQTGRVTAVYTPDYQPFGEEAGEGQAVTPVAVLCESMLSGCEELEAPPPEDEG